MIITDKGPVYRTISNTFEFHRFSSLTCPKVNSVSVSQILLSVLPLAFLILSSGTSTNPVVHAKNLEVIPDIFLFLYLSY